MLKDGSIAAAAEALATIGKAGSDQELERQLLTYSRVCRELAGEVAKGNAMLKAKDAEISELRQLNAELTRQAAGAVVRTAKGRRR